MDSEAICNPKKLSLTDSRFFHLWLEVQSTPLHLYRDALQPLTPMYFLAARKIVGKILVRKANLNISKISRRRQVKKWEERKLQVYCCPRIAPSWLNPCFLLFWIPLLAGCRLFQMFQPRPVGWVLPLHRGLQYSFTILTLTLRLQSNMISDWKFLEKKKTQQDRTF